MFEEGHHYNTKSFGYNVIAIDGDRMVVIKDDGEKVVLSHNLQTHIQENIGRDQLHPSSSQSKDISEFQKNSLIKYKDYRAGGIVVECITCHTHSPIFDVDELKEFYSIHPAHETLADDGYYDSTEIESVLEATKRVPPQWKRWVRRT